MFGEDFIDEVFIEFKISRIEIYMYNKFRLYIILFLNFEVELDIYEKEL